MVAATTWLQERILGAKTKVGNRADPRPAADRVLDAHQFAGDFDVRNRQYSNEMAEFSR